LCEEKSAKTIVDVRKKRGAVETKPHWFLRRGNPAWKGFPEKKKVRPAEKRREGEKQFHEKLKKKAWCGGENRACKGALQKSISALEGSRAAERAFKPNSDRTRQSGNVESGEKQVSEGYSEGAQEWIRGSARGPKPVGERKNDCDSTAGFGGLRLSWKKNVTGFPSLENT